MNLANRVDDSYGRARVRVIVLVVETAEFAVGGQRKFVELHGSFLRVTHLRTFYERHIFARSVVKTD